MKHSSLRTTSWRWRPRHRALALLLLVGHVLPAPATATEANAPGPTYGPAGEPCATDGLIVEPGGDWQRTIEDALPGSTILMRGGSYPLRGTLELPSGAEGLGITIKPLRCEKVVLLASAETFGVGHVLEPGSFVTVAGLYVVSESHESLLRIGAGRRQVVLRNDSLIGGRNDAVVISGGEGIVFEGNYIDSGPGQRAGITNSSGGHIFYLKGEGSAGGARGVRIVGNHLEGAHYGDLVAGDDVFAVQAGDDILIAGNRISNQFNIENIIDIKIRNGSTPVVFRNNLAFDNFKGSQGGQDHGAPAPCITIGDNRSPPLQHVIEGNVFDGCPAGFLSVGGGSRTGSALIVDNLFIDRSGDPRPAAGAIARAVDTEIAHNVFYHGALKIARGGSGCSSAKMPVRLRIRDNVFYRTDIVDQTDACPSIDYLLAHNVLYDLPQGFERGRREGNLELDPGFRGAETGDFSLLPDSPAIGAASDGRDIGRDAGR